MSGLRPITQRIRANKALVTWRAQESGLPISASMMILASGSISSSALTASGLRTAVAILVRMPETARDAGASSRIGGLCPV